jgi:DNA-binding HxlR family transcriptional regulator
MSPDWDDLSYVISSQYRTAVLNHLNDGPATPSQIAKDTDMGIAHISRALQQLRNEEIVELLVSDDRKKGRIYSLTEYGRTVWEKMDAENMV